VGRELIKPNCVLDHAVRWFRARHRVRSFSLGIRGFFLCRCFDGVDDHRIFSCVDCTFPTLHQSTITAAWQANGGELGSGEQQCPGHGNCFPRSHRASKEAIFFGEVSRGRGDDMHSIILFNDLWWVSRDFLSRLL